jgi:glycine cleavage system H protein
MESNRKIGIVACAGMDKAVGTIAALSAFKVCENLPDKTELICLPPMLTGVSPYPELVKNLPIIAIDGCAQRCSTKLIVKNGGKIRGRILISDISKKENLALGSASNIGADGVKLADIVAQEIMKMIDRVGEG